jgi:hypothetical protein
MSTANSLSATQPARTDATTAVARLISFLETGTVPDDLFAPDVFADLSLPHWRVQTDTADAIVAERMAGHPFPGQVRVERVEPTNRGFTMEFEERWEHEGQRWYCREMIRADVVRDTIVELSIYCTGDWDEAKQREHRQAVRLIRP